MQLMKKREEQRLQRLESRWYARLELAEMIGVDGITDFADSRIWKWLYAFPQTTAKQF